MALRLTITGAAVLAGVSHLIWPNLKIDGVVTVLLGIAVVPWLGLIFDSLELPGGWKFQYRKLEEKVNKVNDKVDDAQGAAASAERKAEFAEIVSASVGIVGAADVRLRELAAEYNRVREEQSSSSARTAAMTRVVGEMVRFAPDASELDWTSALSSRDAGVRLAAYARLYARPEASGVQLLVKALTSKGEGAFGQYWGLRALRRCAALADTDTIAAVKPALEQFLTRLTPGSDRHYELSRLLSSLDR